MTALLGKDQGGEVRSAQIPTTLDLQRVPGSTTDNPVVVGPGRNGVTYNFIDRITIEMVITVASLPPASGAGPFRESCLFARGAEDLQRTGRKNQLISGGVNYEGRVVFAIADDYTLLSPGNLGDTDGADALNIDGGNNFRHVYHRGGSVTGVAPDIVDTRFQNQYKIGEFIGDGGGGTPGLGSGNEHAIYCVTAPGVIKPGPGNFRYHLVFTLDGTRMRIVVNGVILGDFKAPAGGTVTRSDKFGFVDTNWYLGAHPLPGEGIPASNPIIWYHGFRIWSKDIPPAKVGSLQELPFQSQAIVANGSEEVRVVSSFAFDDIDGVLDTQDYGEAANTIIFSNTDPEVDINGVGFADPPVAPSLSMGHGPS